MNHKKKLGKLGEDIVARHLQQEGFTILAQNYRKYFGEVDLIATKSELLIFVEVKTRQRIYGDLTEVIVPSKQKKIICVAKEFIAQNNMIDKVCRFDVALVEGDQQNVQLRYIPNAFHEQEY